MDNPILKGLNPDTTLMGYVLRDAVLVQEGCQSTGARAKCPQSRPSVN